MSKKKIKTKVKEKKKVKKIAKIVRKPKKYSKEKISLLKDIVVSIAGVNAAEIVDLLQGKNNVNEYNIAKKLEITINQARNILYKLGDEGLVSFTRKKDKKSGGWYTYFWTLDDNKSLINLKGRIVNEILRLEYQIASKKTKRFYFCNNCDIEMSEENALQYDFTCPECGEVFVLKDNMDILTHFEKEIETLKHKIELIDVELELINKKEETLKKRRLTLEAKKKKAERDARRKEREKEKLKEAKKLGKTVKGKVKKKDSKKKKSKKKVVLNKTKVNRKKKLKKKTVGKKAKGKLMRRK